MDFMLFLKMMEVIQGYIKLWITNHQSSQTPTSHQSPRAPTAHQKLQASTLKKKYFKHNFSNDPYKPV